MHKILLAEDDVYLREAYMTILSSAGYDIEGVENGRLALESIEASVPVVLLLDMLMPVMSGLEVLEVLEQKDMLKSMKIIAFTNLSDKTTMDRLEKFGIDKYLLKSSVMPKDLVAAVGALVDKKAQIS